MNSHLFTIVIVLKSLSPKIYYRYSTPASYPQVGKKECMSTHYGNGNISQPPTTCSALRHFDNNLSNDKMATADTRMLTEYLLEQEDDELEEVLLQYMADEDLHVQEHLNRARLDLNTLSDERLVTMPPSHSVVNAGISFVASQNLKRFNFLLLSWTTKCSKAGSNFLLSK